MYSILLLVPISLSPPLLQESVGRKKERSFRETCWTVRLSQNVRVTSQTQIRSDSIQEKKKKTFLPKTITSVPASVTTRNRQGLRKWNSSVHRRDCQALCWSSGCRVSEDTLHPLRSSRTSEVSMSANKQHNRFRC